MKSFLTRCLYISMFLVALTPGVHATANEPVELHWIDELLRAVWEPAQELVTELVELSPFEMEVDLVEGEEAEASVSEPDAEPEPQEMMGHVQPIG